MSSPPDSIQRSEAQTGSNMSDGMAPAQATDHGATQVEQRQASGVELRRDASMRHPRKGRIDVSGSSPPTPQSFGINAVGEISTPTREQSAIFEASPGRDEQHVTDTEDHETKDPPQASPIDHVDQVGNPEQPSGPETVDNDVDMTEGPDLMPQSTSLETDYQPELDPYRGRSSSDEVLAAHTPDTIRPSQVDYGKRRSTLPNLDLSQPSDTHFEPKSRFDASQASPPPMIAPPATPATPATPVTESVPESLPAQTPANLLKLAPNTIDPIPTNNDFQSSSRAFLAQNLVNDLQEQSRDFLPQSKAIDDLPNGQLNFPQKTLAPLAQNLPSSLPGSPINNPLGRKRRLVDRLRGLLLRRGVLRVVFGREVADVMHPHLQGGKGVTNTAGLGGNGQIDGTSHSRIYVTEKWRSQQAQRAETLNQHIAEAAEYAEMERRNKCDDCGGLFANTAIKRHHRLLSKKDKKDLGQNRARRVSYKDDIPPLCKCWR